MHSPLHQATPTPLRYAGGILFAFGLSASALPVYAQDNAFTLTVAPPLFQLALQPGEAWKSGIQVVNVNPYDITVYAEPVLFRPRGDDGQPEFYVPDAGTETSDTQTLAGWITVPQGAVTIPREQTFTLPLTITVPLDAPPGGHYAAVLIGTRPPEGGTEGSALSVTSSIASLVFLRVAGNVVEHGRVREFSTEKSLYQDAEARFTLRFENQGNVHLRPQGDITIFNMFGKKRGYVPINQEGEGYGSVLPGSTRKYAFNWKSDTGMWDIGRYRAEATIGYGEEAKQFTHAIAYFYVLPILPLIEIMLGVGLLAWFLIWSLRVYIRRALYIESVRMKVNTGSTPSSAQAQYEPRVTLGTLIRPIQAGIVDLRSIGSPDVYTSAPPVTTGSQPVRGTPTPRATLRAFVREYRTFFIFVALASLGWVASSAYFTDVLTYERTYEIVLEEEVPVVDEKIAEQGQ